MFKPEDNVQLAHGAPIQTDFMQTRQMPSQHCKCIALGATESCSGVSLGYTTNGAGGFNSGMTDRQSWLPPTVDDLRTKTNPITYNLSGHEGAATSQENRNNWCRKTRRSSHAMGPEHWLPTTGSTIEKCLIPNK